MTATLNGKTLSDDLRFSLTIDKDFSGSATRDQDYTAVMAPLTIPDRKVSGKATITISPRNMETGLSGWLLVLTRLLKKITER